MRRVVFLLTVLVASPAIADFNPEFNLVCTPKEIKPGEFGQLSSRKLLGQAIKLAGLSAIDLDTEGNEVSLTAEKDAILDPAGYCNVRDRCSKGTLGKLAEAFTNIDGFIRNNDPKLVVKSKSGYFDIHSDNDPLKRVTVRELLADKLVGVTARCIVPPRDDEADGNDEKKQKTKNAHPDKTPVAQRLMIRKKVTDLQYAQDDKQFKGLDRASLSVVDDYLKRNITYNLSGVAGFGISHVSLGKSADADIIGYATYTKQTVTGNAPKNSKDVDNIGLGLMASALFPAFGDYHALQVYPQYLRSNVSEGELFSGNIVYTPQTWPGVGAPFPIFGDLVGLFTPQAKFVWGRVTAHGRDPDFVADKDFSRVGARVEFLAMMDDGLLKGFSWRNAYEYQYGMRGYYRSVDRFESTLSYKFPDQQNWSLDLAYISGRNLDTLELQQQLTLGLGLKY